MTTDALGCQKEIAKKIVKEKKADYVLALKGNHHVFHQEVEEYFNDAEKRDFKDAKITQHRTLDKGHGRIEERLYYYSTDINWIKIRGEWEKVHGIGMVIRKCEVNGLKTVERAYHVASVKTVEDYAKGARLHWGIESTHWSLDVTFREDANKTRKGNAPENLALIKRLTLNMLKNDQTRYPKKALKRKRFIALLSTDYLEYIFDINFSELMEA